MRTTTAERWTGAAPYIGRFAPSPTGPLHLGSLTTAVTSFLHARQAGGRWLVRIDDIDPPREVPGAAELILRTLEALELDWDGPVLYQSSRTAHYRAAAEDLLARGLAFRCSCSRREIRARGGGRYPGTCRGRSDHRAATALRARVETPGTECFLDGLQGRICTDVGAEHGDYVVFRRDGLPAYHLACVLDDAEQGVNTVVRGNDLLSSTSVQLHLQGRFGFDAPAYYHLPVLTHAGGEKLSKQTGAPGVDAADPPALAMKVLRLLRLEPPEELSGAPPAELWRWAITHWDIGAWRGVRSIPVG